MLGKLRMLENLRIHLLGIGTKHEWIIKSIDRSRPDKIYLFRKENENHLDALKAEKEVLKILKKKSILVEIVEYEEKGLFPLLNKVREIIESEKNNFIYLNVSSGQRIVFLSFAIANMMFKSLAKGLRLYSMEEGDFEKLPVFEVKLPSKDLVASMKFIASKGNECSKSQLKKYVFDNKIIKTEKNNDPNQYMLLNRRIIDKLLQWDFIQIEGKNKGATIKLKEEGQNLIKFL